MPTRGSKDPNGRALRGRRAHTTFALLTDPARQIWNSFNNRANAGGADAPEAAVNGCLYDRFKSLYNKTATKPSLVIVPARFKSGTLYSQIPSSNADFTVTRPLNTATRFDSSALIQTGITSGVPRLDYYTSGGVTGCPALLVEPAATNLALQSDGLSVSGTWSISNNTQVTANTTGTTDPAGSTLSDLIFCQATGTFAQGVTQSISIATSGTYTMSVFVKKASNFDWFRIQFQDPAAAVHQVYYNLVSGTLGTVDAGSTGTITNFGNGWYRLTHSRSTASGTIGFGLRLANANSSLTVPCDGISGAFLWGAQVETGSVATSYIPTTTVTGSRSADVISVSGAVSGSIGQTEGTIYLDFSTIVGTNSNVIFALGDSGAGQNRLRILGNTSRELRFIFQLNGNVIQYDFIRTGAVTSLTDFKIAIAYKSGDIAVAINGVLANTSSNALTFSGALNSVELSAAVVGFLTQRYRAVALYTTRLTNDELQSLTQT